LLISEDGANLTARVTPIAFSASGKVWVNNHAHVMRFESRATQCYIENLINILDVSNYVTGTAQPKLNQAKLNSIPIPVPELSQQETYYQFVKQTDKSKFVAYQETIFIEKILKYTYNHTFRRKNNVH
jgi:restriction endonuclease S subunit